MVERPGRGRPASPQARAGFRGTEGSWLELQVAGESWDGAGQSTETDR